jgi:hypothetical protein
MELSYEFWHYKVNFYTFLQFLIFFISDIRILHDGPCKYKDIVLPSDVNQLCHLADNNAIIMPVCGSNNVTYPNLFVLKCAKIRGVVSPGTSAVCKVVFTSIYEKVSWSLKPVVTSGVILTSNQNLGIVCGFHRQWWSNIYVTSLAFRFRQ